MASAYEIRRDGIVDGPFSGAQLKALAAADTLRQVDQIRKLGDHDWHPATAFHGLFPPTASNPDPGFALSSSVPAVPTSLSPPPQPPAPADPAAGADLEPRSADEPPSVLAWLLTGFLTLSGALLLSLLKPTIGAVGLLAIALGLGILLALVVWIFGSTQRSLESRLGCDEALAARRNRIRNLAALGAVVPIVLALAAAAEFATPDSGFTRSLVARFSPAPPPAVAPPTPPPPLDAAPWKSADFILADAADTAVAVKHQPSPTGFLILARAEGEQGREAQDVAWSSSVQIIDEDPSSRAASSRSRATLSARASPTTSTSSGASINTCRPTPPWSLSTTSARRP